MKLVRRSDDAAAIQYTGSPKSLKDEKASQSLSDAAASQNRERRYYMRTILLVADQSQRREIWRLIFMVSGYYHVIKMVPIRKTRSRVQAIGKIDTMLALTPDEIWRLIEAPQSEEWQEELRAWCSSRHRHCVALDLH